MRLRWIILTLPLLFLALLAAAACGDDDDGGGASATDSGGGGGDVGVTLLEFSVLPDPDSAPAGNVNFLITNDGPADQHEFVVIKTDLAPSELPTDENGAVDEAGDGIEVIGEVEAIDVGASKELSVNLEAGAYVLICNIYDETENEAHYQEGMQAAFTVE